MILPTTTAARCRNRGCSKDYRLMPICKETIVFDHIAFNENGNAVFPAHAGMNRAAPVALEKVVK